MGYLNPIIQFGIEDFCQKCSEVGIDGLIIPDLPVKEFSENYQAIFEAHGLINVFLITPQTSADRIRFIDQLSSGFIYMVSSASVTGVKNEFGETQNSYFERINGMNLNAPQIVGFGISNAKTFGQATKFGKGAIIGSAFIKHLSTNGTKNIQNFVNNILYSTTDL